jgi:hypothetical protein
VGVIAAAELGSLLLSLLLGLLLLPAPIAASALCKEPWEFLKPLGPLIWLGCCCCCSGTLVGVAAPTAAEGASPACMTQQEQQQQ